MIANTGTKVDSPTGETSGSNHQTDPRLVVGRSAESDQGLESDRELESDKQGSDSEEDAAQSFGLSLQDRVLSIVEEPNRNYRSPLLLTVSVDGRGTLPADSVGVTRSLPPHHYISTVSASVVPRTPPLYNAPPRPRD
eukprot:4679940-Pyramimonas_sp.AAC.1